MKIKFSLLTPPVPLLRAGSLKWCGNGSLYFLLVGGEYIYSQMCLSMQSLPLEDSVIDLASFQFPQQPPDLPRPAFGSLSTA